MTDRDCPLTARCLLVGGAGACSLTEESNCPSQPCPSGTVCLGGVCATGCTTDTDCPGGPCTSVTIAGMTVRGCGDPRVSDAGARDGGSNDDAAADGGVRRVVAIAASRHTTCALGSAGELWCWGANNALQLGDNVATHDGACTDSTGTVSDHSIRPVRAMLVGATQIAVGDDHTCARLDGPSHLGEARCWGNNNAGELGTPLTGGGSGTPVRVVDSMGASITGVVQLAAGGDSTVAVTTTGMLGWGDGHTAQIGLDTMSGYDTLPLRAPLPAGVLLHDVSIQQSGVGIDADGNVRAWGWNLAGSIGRMTAEDALYQDYVVVGALSGVREVALRDFAVCARTATDVLCWGSPWTALARDGDHSVSPFTSSAGGSAYPASVVGLAGRIPIDVAVAGNGTCIVVQGGSVLCTSVSSETLALRADVPPMASLVAGLNYYCGIAIGGRVICWGSGTCGQTGDPAHPMDGAPHEVVLP